MRLMQGRWRAWQWLSRLGLHMNNPFSLNTFEGVMESRRVLEWNFCLLNQPLRLRSHSLDTRTVLSG